MIIFLSFALNMCFGCSNERSHWDGSFEYPQHMFWMRNKKNNFQVCILYLEVCYGVVQVRNTTSDRVAGWENAQWCSYQIKNNRVQENSQTLVKKKQYLPVIYV